MNDNSPDSYEELERVFQTAPQKALEKLPDCIASRRAKQLLPTVYDYVKEARELVRPVESLPTETPSEASMRRAKESFGC